MDYILFLSYLSIAVYIAAFPDEMLSVYFSSAFSFFITFEHASIKLPTLALNEEKIILSKYLLI